MRDVSVWGMRGMKGMRDVCVGGDEGDEGESRIPTPPERRTRKGG